MKKANRLNSCTKMRQTMEARSHTLDELLWKLYVRTQAVPRMTCTPGMMPS